MRQVLHMCQTGRTYPELGRPWRVPGGINASAIDDGRGGGPRRENFGAMLAVSTTLIEQIPHEMVYSKGQPSLPSLIGHSLGLPGI
jgi:hypothetical protein